MNFVKIIHYYSKLFTGVLSLTDCGERPVHLRRPVHPCGCRRGPGVGAAFLGGGDDFFVGLEARDGRLCLGRRTRSGGGVRRSSHPLQIDEVIAEFFPDLVANVLRSF